MIKKTSPQAFFFGQEFDRFAKAAIPGSDAESALAYEPPTSLRTSSILSLSSSVATNAQVGKAKRNKQEWTNRQTQHLSALECRN